MWKANGKTNTLLIFLDRLFPKTEIYLRDASSGDKTIRRVTTPPHVSPGEWLVFLSEICYSWSYSKKECKRKASTHRQDWNVECKKLA
jgi:hypothetical protein